MDAHAREQRCGEAARGASLNRCPSGRSRGTLENGCQGAKERGAVRSMGALCWDRANDTIHSHQGLVSGVPVAYKAWGEGAYRGPIVNDHGLQAPRYAESH